MHFDGREAVNSVGKERGHALAAGGAVFTVDLRQQLVRSPDGAAWTFQVEPLRRESLLQGLDEIGLTLQHTSAIDAWERADRAARPWNWPA